MTSSSRHQWRSRRAAARATVAHLDAMDDAARTELATSLGTAEA